MVFDLFFSLIWYRYQYLITGAFVVVSFFTVMKVVGTPNFSTTLWQWPEPELSNRQLFL